MYKNVLFYTICHPELVSGSNKFSLKAFGFVRFSFFSLQTPERKERKTEPKRKKIQA